MLARLARAAPARHDRLHFCHARSDPQGTLRPVGAEHPLRHRIRRRHLPEPRLGLGFFNKRVGTMYRTTASTTTRPPSIPSHRPTLFLNYTLRDGSRVRPDEVPAELQQPDRTRTTSPATSITGAALTQNVATNGTNYVDPFTTNGQTPIAGTDNVSVMSARSIVMSVTFGFGAKR